MLEGDNTRMVVQTVISDWIDRYSGQRKSQAKFLQTIAGKGIAWDLPFTLTIPVAVFLRWVGRRATAKHWHCKGLQRWNMSRSLRGYIQTHSVGYLFTNSFTFYCKILNLIPSFEENKSRLFLASLFGIQYYLCCNICILISRGKWDFKNQNFMIAVVKSSQTVQ